MPPAPVEHGTITRASNFTNDNNSQLFGMRSSRTEKVHPRSPTRLLITFHPGIQYSQFIICLIRGKVTNCFKRMRNACIGVRHSISYSKLHPKHTFVADHVHNPICRAISPLGPAGGRYGRRHLISSHLISSDTTHTTPFITPTQSHTISVLIVFPF